MTQGQAVSVLARLVYNRPSELLGKRWKGCGAHDDSYSGWWDGALPD